MRPVLLPVLAALVGACVSDDGVGRRHSGTAVGNPGDMDVAARTPGLDVPPDRVWVPVAGVALETCDGGAVPIAADTVLDGLFPSFEPVPLPPGRFCGVHLELAEPVIVEGATAAGTTYEVSLDLDGVALFGRFDIDGQTLLVDVPLVLDDDILDALGPDAVLAADDPDARAWAAVARAEAVLVVDEDDDGAVDPGEPAVAGTIPPADAGPVAAQSAAGCGCTSVAPRWGWLTVLSVAVAVGRRRRGAPISDDFRSNRG